MASERIVLAKSLTRIAPNAITSLQAEKNGLDVAGKVEAFVRETRF